MARNIYGISPKPERPTGHADLDLTSRVGLRDILFNYTGRMDMSLYRRIGTPMAKSVETVDGVQADVLDPEFSPAVQEFASGPESRMDDADYMRSFSPKSHGSEPAEDDGLAGSDDGGTSPGEGTEPVPPASSGSDPAGDQK